MVSIPTTSEEIRKLISEIPDPEIPVITIEELGILRSIELKEGACVINISPTYSGCPAMKLIERQIISILQLHGIKNITVKLVYAPAWTTDSMSEVAKDKLNRYGIAPPRKEIVCPQCGSKDTELISAFGSTACKALHRCKSCKEPFESFKCI